MPRQAEINPGDRFGRLVIVRKLPDPIRRNTAYLCICEGSKAEGCKGYSIVIAEKLTRKTSPVRSCGCLRGASPNLIRAITKHGEGGRNRSLTYRSWSTLRGKVSRMELGDIPQFPIDPRWEDYREFLKDMGEKPRGSRLTLRDKTIGYFKGNAYWKGTNGGEKARPDGETIR